MRKKFAVLLVGLFLTLLCVPTTKASASVQDFEIPSFSADYYLNRNDEKTSTLEVHETITAKFPDIAQNHGILRAIPASYQGHTVSLEIIKVTNAVGKPYPYTTSNSNDNLVLKIGDPGTYAYGLNTYIIQYRLRNVINFQETDEFYWDINGDQWPQRMESVTARLHIPSKLAPELTGQTQCYTGLFGSTSQNCQVTRGSSSEETVITAQANRLGANETLTVVAGFKKGTFQLGPEVAAEKRRALMKVILFVGTTMLLPLTTFVVLYRRWRRDGKDPKGRGVIIPEYISPKGLNVLSSAFVLHQVSKPASLSAGIIELATHGYIKLHEIEKKKFLGKTREYELELVKDPGKLSEEQRKLITALFGSFTTGNTVKLVEQKNKLHSTVGTIGKHLAQDLTTRGYFVSNPEKARSRFTLGATIMLVAGFILFFLFPVGIGLILSALIAFGFNTIMPVRTEQGVTTRDYLLGLKEYISLAEKDRIAYLQSPQGAEKVKIDPNNHKAQVKLFEDLLPYAMLFGLEEDWAKQFKDLYTQPPSWYSGNMSTFNSVYLAHSLSGFNSANTAAFTSPSSSGSSGFSGGSAGGGGGGGGGGGW